MLIETVISAQVGTIFLTMGSVSLTIYIFKYNELRNLDQRIDALTKAERGINSLCGIGVTIMEVRSGRKNEVDYLYELNSEDRLQVNKIYSEECNKIDQSQPNTLTLRGLTKTEDLNCYTNAIFKVKIINEGRKKIINNKINYLKILIIIFFAIGLLVELLSLEPHFITKMNQSLNGWIATFSSLFS